MSNRKHLFQEFLRKQIFRFRSKNSLSQERMSELLHVSPRSYFDQEHGKYGFSSLSLITFLLLLSEDEVLDFLQECRNIAQDTDKESAA